MHRRTKVSHFPPLKTAEGQWLREADQKANAFAQSFSCKFSLPPETTEQFFFFSLSNMCAELIIRSRFVRRELKGSAAVKLQDRMAFLPFC